MQHISLSCSLWGPLDDGDDGGGSGCNYEDNYDGDNDYDGDDYDGYDYDGDYGGGGGAGGSGSGCRFLLLIQLGTSLCASSISHFFPAPLVLMLRNIISTPIYSFHFTASLFFLIACYMGF